MKNKFIAIWAILVISWASIAAQEVRLDSIRTTLDRLMSSDVPADKIRLENEIKKLESSPSEKQVDIAIGVYQRLKNLRAADSLQKLSLKRFPRGVRARNQVAYDKIYVLKTPEETERAYKKWIAEFPPAEFHGDDLLTYDYVVKSIATGYAEAKNTAKAIEFGEKLQVDFWKGNGYAALADAFHKSGDIKNSLLYYRRAMESAKSYYEGKLAGRNSSAFAASGYPGLVSIYANVLYENKRYQEALNYLEVSAKLSKEISPSSALLRARILMALNRNEEAYNDLEAVIKNGKSTDEMNDLFKTLYIKVKGGEQGFDKFAAEIRAANLSALEKKLAKEIISIPAAEFTLRDLEGKQVSLNELKGKTVILDFWATWCAPCKASFPAMQLAVNKYRNDSTVKFLFIHTWERSASPDKDADDFIKSQNYTFQVLMDKKDPQTKINKVVSDYKVSGIPAKFVIDPLGNIRFTMLGFQGSNQAAVDELSMMIAMSKQAR